VVKAGKILAEGTIAFSIESRVLRELGERLVKQPEVAIVELVKNAYDADATECTISYEPGRSIIVEDNGIGISFPRFRDGWMRIGTSSKEDIRFSETFLRLITGEKGIGRFAVRFLGRELRLESVAIDPKLGVRTRLEAFFDWPKFDRHEDLGKILVPYTVREVAPDTPLGTRLEVTRIRAEARRLDLKKIRTGSINILTPLRSLFREATGGDLEVDQSLGLADPGFSLNIQDEDEDFPEDVASEILESFTLRARLELKGNKLDLRIFKRGENRAYLKIVETYPNDLTGMYADIRFFPRREGAFAGLPVDGRLAYSWIVRNSGVAVFDRKFRVQPYGSENDDWLQLQADAARNRRDPRSSLAVKHFPMSVAERAAPSENWMLRLPQSAQLIGLVQVEGTRNTELKDADEESEDRGLIASADREGFVENLAFHQLVETARAAVEAIAFADRKIQLEDEQREREELHATLRLETRTAIREIRADPNIAAPTKERIVAVLATQQKRADEQEDFAREREQQLEVMSLLGVVAGFMTHEFGVAIQELEETKSELVKLAKVEPKFQPAVDSFTSHIKSLNEFVTYSSGYIQGAKAKPKTKYPVRPRLLRVKRVFGKYAEERNIDVEITVEKDLLAPLVPASLYDGIALNLYTNALKAVTGKKGGGRGAIAFRSWNEGRWHYLEVSDSGVGIPASLQSRVFDPLFTTTESQNDPLGSGMGLGLALVRRGAEAFGGRAELTAPPPNFSTCVRVRLPIK